MSGYSNPARQPDRRAARHRETVDEIVAAAWELSRANGLGGFSMRELGARVGMRAQSLYSYFSSKHDLYDAMFADANRAFLAWMRAGTGEQERGEGMPLDQLIATAERYFEFCVEDPVRYQLLFQRTIPGFEPSPASYQLAVEAYEVGIAPLRAIGFTDADLDLATAVVSGLAAQQIANDPGGTRWARQVERGARMLIAAVRPDLVPADTASRDRSTAP